MFLSIPRADRADVGHTGPGERPSAERREARAARRDDADAGEAVGGAARLAESVAPADLAVAPWRSGGGYVVVYRCEGTETLTARRLGPDAQPVGAVAMGAGRAPAATREAPLLLDVREPWEFRICSIQGSQLIPMGQIPASIKALDPERETVVICHHGIRSRQVAMFLEYQGFSKVINLAGGVDAWARDIARMMPTY